MQADPARWRPALNQAVLYALLAPYDHDAHLVLQQLAADKRLQKLPAAHAAVEALIGQELIAWPIPQEAHWRADPLFSTPGYEELEDEEDRVPVSDSSSSSSSSSCSSATAMTDEDDAPRPREDGGDSIGLSSTGAPLEKVDPWAVFRKRIVQHNIRVVSRYFKRIRSARLAQLLQLDMNVGWRCALLANQSSIRCVCCSLCGGE